MTKRVLTESGEWREGGARPALLPAELRKLPGELVTKDADDPDKAHADDAPHVVSTIVKDFARAHGDAPKDDTPEKVTKKLWAPGPGEHARVTQWFVDVVKMRVIAAQVKTWLGQFQRGKDPDLTPCHLWFRTNNANDYVLRMGNPPPNRDRPRYMRDINLVVDVMNPPRSIIAELHKRGVEFDPQKLLEQTREETRLVHLA